ncbi:MULTISPECIES: BRO family protein [unclassified Paraburkholderia]|uniref:BRO-N domain-containing protein n=1 Tax=unclassified Paraburkholderia TaxID=2615204 RepID=UPI00161D73DC|nr:MULTISPECIES: BRO family protein [unclassified Paraburkholderia]MBB5444668.1 prophage antirepressor-like protein [Paraburkholderia sp. WSM4177]MBB5485493.1 prophage antirepressor-like protein [Paraburkholderia sp. WSM4180]
MNNIVPFHFESHELRVVTDEQGNAWFPANAICQVLGFGNPRQAVESHVDEDDVQKLDVIDSLGRTQLANHINESGLYALILGSTKEEAKRFKRWVTHDVLPSIRKTGAYVAPIAAAHDRSAAQATMQAAKLFPPFFKIARLMGCDKQAAAISANQAVREVSGQNLLALLGQTHVEADNQESKFYTPTELGKMINTSARGTNLLLAEAGFQMKRGEHWEVTDAGKDFARIYDTGKRHGSGVPVQQVKWSAEVLPALGRDGE